MGAPAAALLIGPLVASTLLGWCLIGDISEPGGGQPILAVQVSSDLVGLAFDRRSEGAGEDRPSCRGLIPEIRFFDALVLSLVSNRRCHQWSTSAIRWRTTGRTQQPPTAARARTMEGLAGRSEAT